MSYSRSKPPLDEEGDTELEVKGIEVEDGWTSVTFVRNLAGNDDTVRVGLLET